MTLSGRDLWRRRVEATPDRPFLVDDERTRTFAEADVEARRLAAGFEALGVGLGTRVLIGLPNATRTVLVHQALRELGAVLVPLLPGLTADELAYQVAHSGATVLVAEDEVADALGPQLDRFPALREVRVGPGAVDGLCADDPLPVRDLPGYHDRSPAQVLYTSGSTGRPKGVVLPAGSVPSAGRNYADRFEIGPDDNYILPLTLAHAAGAVTAQGIALHSGCRLTVVDRFSPSRFWGQVARHGATVSILFPSQLNLLLMLEQDGPARGETPLRLAITHTWMEAFRERFGVEVALCWGMTETGATSVLSVPGDRPEDHAEGYVGTPGDGVEIAIMDGSRRLGPDEPGEIALRHRHAMLEYLDDPEATARTLVDGWVRSGDLGRVDEAGRVYYLGRIKTMIKRSGENVSPEEVEGVLVEHPAVTEALVFGVADPIRSQEVAAVVVTEEDLEPEELSAFAAQRLARWKLPRYIRIERRPFPRRPNGKIDRTAVIGEGDDPDLGWDREAVAGRGRS